MYEKEIDELERLLDDLNENLKDDLKENYYLYICMVLASDKLEGNIKQSTRHKIEEMKEYLRQ